MRMGQPQINTHQVGFWPLFSLGLVYVFLALFFVLGQALTAQALTIDTLESTGGLSVRVSWLGTCPGEAGYQVSWGDGTSTIDLGAGASWAPHTYGEKGKYLVRVAGRNNGVDVCSVSQYVVAGDQAQEFSIHRMELKFGQRGKTGSLFPPKAFAPGTVNVPRNSTSLTALADITYQGTGILRAYWKVDGVVVGMITKQLLPGMRQVSLTNPEIPSLPTFAPGRHRVEFEVLNPALSFTSPVIHYFVTEEEGGEKPLAVLLQTPAQQERLMLNPDTNTFPGFTWAAHAGERVSYVFELYTADSGPGRLITSSTQYLTGETPLIKAKTNQNGYAISPYDIEKLVSDVPYLWRVQAIDQGRLKASSEYRTVFFMKEQADPTQAADPNSQP